MKQKILCPLEGARVGGRRIDISVLKLLWIMKSNFSLCIVRSGLPWLWSLTVQKVHFTKQCAKPCQAPCQTGLNRQVCIQIFKIVPKARKVSKSGLSPQFTYRNFVDFSALLWRAHCHQGRHSYRDGDVVLFSLSCGSVQYARRKTGRE